MYVYKEALLPESTIKYFEGTLWMTSAMDLRHLLYKEEEGEAEQWKYTI